MTEEASKTEQKDVATPSLASGFLIFLGTAGGIVGLIVFGLTLLCWLAGSLFL